MAHIEYAEIVVGEFIELTGVNPYQIEAEAGSSPRRVVVSVMDDNFEEIAYAALVPIPGDRPILTGCWKRLKGEAVAGCHVVVI